MDERFDARAELDEGAKRRNAGDFALDDIAFLEGFNLLQPWVIAHLLETQGQAVFVDSDDLGLDGLADFDIAARVVDALPGNFGNMDQTLNAVNVDEGAKVDNAGDHAFDDVTNFEFGETELHVVFDGFFLRKN